MSRTEGKLNFALNFERQINAPLDATTAVTTTADLTGTNTFISTDGNNYCYYGMLVSVTEPNNAGIYKLVDLGDGVSAVDAQKKMTNWKLIAGGIISTQDGDIHIKADKTITLEAGDYLNLPHVNQISYSGNYLQQGWYYQHFDISGLGTDEEIVDGTKNTVIFWLSDSTEQIVEDIQEPTYIPGFNSKFQVGWWLTGVNDGRFPSEANCHFEITQIDANKITVKLYAIATRTLWWVNDWLRNGKVDLGGSLSKDDYTVYCNGANVNTFSEKIEQTECGGVILSNISLLVGGANFFGSNKNITCGNYNYTTMGNTLTVGNGLTNYTYSGTVLGSYNEPNGGLLQVGGGTGESDRKTLFSVHAGGDGKIQLNAPTEVYKDVYIKNNKGANSIVINKDAGSIELSGNITTKTGIYTKNSSNANTFTLNAASGDMSVKGNIYAGSTLGSKALKDNISDRVVLVRKNDGGLYKSNITPGELNNLAGTTSSIQTQLNTIKSQAITIGDDFVLNSSKNNIFTQGPVTYQKGWYYNFIDKSGIGTSSNWSNTESVLVVYLTDKQVSSPASSGVVNSGFKSGFAVNDVVTLVDDNHMVDDFTITAIDGNKITIRGGSTQLAYDKITGAENGWCSVDSITNNDYSLYCTSKPSIGNSIVISGSIASRKSTIHSSNSFTWGKENVSKADYSISLGDHIINDTYNGVIVGAFNSANTYNDPFIIACGTSDSNRHNALAVGGRGANYTTLNTTKEKFIFKKPIELNNTTSNRVMIVNSNKQVDTSTITTTQLGYLSGTTSNIQQQIAALEARIAALEAKVK